MPRQCIHWRGNLSFRSFVCHCEPVRTLAWHRRRLDFLSVIAKPVRRLVVAIRSPLVRCRGNTDCHANAAALARNDRFFGSAYEISYPPRLRRGFNPHPALRATFPRGKASCGAPCMTFHTQNRKCTCRGAHCASAALCAGSTLIRRFAPPSPGGRLPAVRRV